jgi:AraC family transcriptional regulator
VVQHIAAKTPGLLTREVPAHTKIVVLGKLRWLGENCSMGFRSFRQRTPMPEVLNGAPRPRPIAHQRQWSLTEYVCTAGPHDRPFEERHDRVSVALVTAGTFRYRTNTGEGLLYPGAYLLGNAGACYECGHEHSHGDRCLALHMDRELFAEIAFGSSGSNRCEFRAALLPALSDLTPISVSLQRASSPESQLALEETVLTAVATVVCMVGTNHTQPRRPTPAATRRMATVFGYIDASLGSDLSLADLSALVAMSKFHFLRTFKRASGMTPYQYILGRRLRAAAAELRATKKPIARVALDQGFGDLSTFNQSFRRVMGVTPTAFRSSK